MKYNLLVQEENNGVLESIIEKSKGKLLIVSDNSFVISTIVEELKERAINGEFNLYNGDRLINTDTNSNTNIIIACVKDIKTFKHPIINNSYHVAFLTRDTIDSFVFNIEIKTSFNCITVENQYELFKDEICVSLDNDSSDNKIHNEIIESLKAHNVVFIQNITDNVVELIKLNKKSVLLVSKINYLTEDYINNKNEEDLIILKYICPSRNDVEYYDQLHIISDIVKSGIIFICDTSWVRLFLELTSIKDDINLTSIVIYNTTNLGPMGNESLYDIKKIGDKYGL